MEDLTRASAPPLPNFRHAHIQTDTHKFRPTDRQTHSDRHVQIDTHTHVHTEKFRQTDRQTHTRTHTVLIVQ